MKRIAEISFTREVDTYADLSYLGMFSKEKGVFAINHRELSGERNVYEWFNAENVENMEQAKENYDRIMEFENGSVCSYGIQAIAEIQTSQDGKVWTTNRIESGGLYGIDSDSGDEYFNEIENEQFEELKKILTELGFSLDEINHARK